jgi:hypothetical protein
MRRALSALLVCLAAGCAADASEDGADVSSDAILGGSVEPSHPAVGMLLFPSGNLGTGTLIAPNVVLTAAHVALGHPHTFFYGSPPPGKPPVRANLKSVAVAEALVHPCYESHVGCGSERIDVALVRLASPVLDVPTVPIVDRPLEWLFGLISPYEGDTCVAVGFGVHEEGAKVTIGTRRSSKSKIVSVGDTELVTSWVTGIATSGDSGGPLLCGGKIVGTVRGSAEDVHSNDPYARTREGYERTDLHRSWIAGALARWH